MKTLQELYNEITASDELKKAFAQSAKDNNVAGFAKEHGVDTTLDEINAFLDELSKSDKELTKDELENAAGGACIIPNPGAVNSLAGVGICNNEPVYTAVNSNCYSDGI